MSAMLERVFSLRESGTTVRTEVVAGLATFSTMSYILFVQPATLAACGMDPGGVFFATCVASAVACFLMAWWTNYPVALAPGMGHNAFFAYVLCGTMGYTWQEGLAATLLTGVLFLVLAGTGLREAILHAVPTSLRHAIAAGIGLLIAMVGLRWGGLIQDHPVILVSLGDLSEPRAGLAVFGTVCGGALLARRVPGALLIGIAATAAVGLIASRWLEQPLVEYAGVVGAPPSPSGTAFALDFASLFGRGALDVAAILITLLIVDLFDTVGTLIGVGEQAGLVRDGRLPKAERAFAADAAGTSLGALLGTSTVTSYVESAAGVASGGRTGLTACVVGACMLLALFFSPLVSMIAGGAGGESAVLAPVLILVGVLMMRSVRHIDWDDMTLAIPAFLTMIVMPVSLSITDGIAWGFIATSLLAIVTGRGRAAGWLVHVIALIFLARYVFLA